MVIKFYSNKFIAIGDKFIAYGKIYSNKWRQTAINSIAINGDKNAVALSLLKN